MTDNQQALTHLYHPAGCKVDIPLSLIEDLTIEHAARLVRSIDALLNAGFTVNLPGLLDGENYEQIGFAVRREKINDDNTTTPVLDVYPANGSFRVLGLYLNTADDVKNFEMATGLRIDSMPLYDGNPIERGSNPRTDRYVVPLAAPAKLVWKLNPKWEGENDKKHPKRIFSRWDGLRPVTDTTLTLGGPATRTQEAAQTSTAPDFSKTKTPGGPRVWTRQDGSAGSNYEVTATTVRFLGGGEQGEHQAAGADDPFSAPDYQIPF